MVLKSINLSLNIRILPSQVLIRKSQVSLFSLRAVKLLLSVAAATLQLAKLRGQLLVTASLTLKSPQKITLLLILAVESPLLAALLLLKSSLLISRFQ